MTRKALPDLPDSSLRVKVAARWAFPDELSAYDPRASASHRRDPREAIHVVLPTTRSDSELTALVREGDPEAYGELWQRHADAGRAAARRITRRFDADDLVAEAFARILEALRAGRGPDGPFRPYLYTTLQRLAATWGTRTAPTVPIDDADHPVEQTDHTARLTEGSLVGRAYASLPTAWAEVLWYTELEELSPAEVAPILGLAPNSAAALAYRAREGLRRAWLQAHVAHLPEKPACRWVAERVGDYHRNALPARALRRFEAHVDECEDCPVLVAEVGDEADILLRARLAGVLWPAVLGAGALLPGVLGTSGAAGAAGTAATSGHGRVVRRVRRGSGAAAVAAVIVAVVALAAVAGVTAWVRSTDAATPTAESSAEAQADGADRGDQADRSDRGDEDGVG
jgi:RNA polymerase sigma factor (sigma-70 family)